LVLALPILLAIMALIINYGTYAAWKVRGLSLARHQLWSQREGRGAHPQKQYWPQYYPGFPAGVSAGAGGAGSVPSLDDARVDHPVIRGPMLETFIVDRDRLDPSRVMREGSSTVERLFPLLKRLGQYTLRSATQAIEHRWQHEHIGLWANYDRRIPLLYTLPRSGAELGLAMRYLQAVVMIWYAPFQADLWPMDMDDEFFYWNVRFWTEGRPGWGPPWAPDFYDRFAWLAAPCDVDEAKAQERVDNLIDRIQGKKPDANSPTQVPSIAESMSQAFVDFFNRVIDELTRQLNATPPPPADVQSQLKKEIQDLKDKIDLLKKPLA
jgi:hypothetical protein